jgi:radical SAM superfamily enzyme YgiQ (UPF0313 family)
VGLQQDYVPMSLWHISTLLNSQDFKPYIKNLNIAHDLKYVNYLERNKRYDSLMTLYAIESDMYYDELDKAINESKPEIIGFTVLTPQIKIVNNLINYINKHYGLPVFVGGAGATLNPIKIEGCNLIFQGGVSD